MCIEELSILSDSLVESDRWGYKTRNLALLLRAGFPVPKGVAVGVQWFLEYRRLREEMNTKQIDALLHLLQSSASEIIKRLKLSGALLARSSSTTEGSSVMSSAGVFESVLIDNSEGIRVGVQRVWDCFFQPEVRAYLTASGPLRVGLGAMIQELIEGKWSGILQTSNVVASDDSAILIEFEECRLGAVVDGRGTPYAIMLEKESGLARHLGEPPGIHLPLQDMRRLALEAEKLFNHSVELEWVVDSKDNLWFVQARPL